MSSCKIKGDKMRTLVEDYDIVVVGAGHAGCEAALAGARLGLNTVMFTVSVDSIALMPCNPNVGGSSKGHLVRELDALGGEICLDMLLEAVAAVVRSNRDHIPNSSSAGRAGIPDRRAHAIFKIGFALLLYFIFQDLARGQNSF